jgi:DNA-binding HxlR family transcriptional regulator
MSVLGGAWTPNIIWNLLGGPRRFSELQIDIPKISAKVLSTKLRTLEAQGIINREVKPTSPPSVEYSLTELGRELVPVIDAIVRVGHKMHEKAANSVV